MGRTISPLFLALVLPVALSATGQRFQPRTIQFKGAPEYSVQEMLAAAGLVKGAILSSDEMGAHSKRLMDSGVFDNLTFTFDGQDLVYTVTLSPQLFPVRMENLPITPGAALDAKLHEKLPLYHGKVPAEGSLLDDVRKELEGMLAAQGIATTVTATPYGDRKSFRKAVTAISFSIAQPPVKVGEIHLEGVSADLASKLQPVVKEAMEQSFDSTNSSANVENAIRGFYEDQGYAAVKVRAVRAGDAVVEADQIRIPFAVTVEEGRPYKLGAIRLPTDAPVEKADIDRTLKSAAASQSQVVGVRTVWMMVSQRYKSKGHLDCVLTPHAEIDQVAGTVDYTLEVNAGPVYHLAFVKFDNVSDQMRVLLMKNWQMLPGDPFDASYAGNFILNAQMHDPVLQRSLSGVKANLDYTADPQTHEVNLVMRLEK
jgi:outer membrane protein assembly factor BamA